MTTEYSEQIVREAPEIEAYKLGLLKSAKALTDQPVGVPVLDASGNPVMETYTDAAGNQQTRPKRNLPTQKIAAMSGLQTGAIEASKGQLQFDASGNPILDAAGNQVRGAGIGGYQDYLNQAGFTTGDAYTPLMGDKATGALGIQSLADPYLKAAGRGYDSGAYTDRGAMISDYMNPYQTAINAEINRAYNLQSAQAGLQAVGQPGGPSAFGGSRAAIQQAEIGRNRASALAQAQAQNFLQAQQAAGQQLDRGMAAGQGLAGLGLQTADALGTLGLRQASLGELAQKQGLMDIETQFNLGKQQQGQQQAELEAKRQSDLAQLYEPYQRYGFLSDIYKGAPSSQSTLTTATAPNVSPAQQYLGLGIAGLSAAAGANKAGLFG